MGGQPVIEDLIQFGRIHAPEDQVDDRVFGNATAFGGTPREGQSQPFVLVLTEALSKARDVGDLSTGQKQGYGGEAQTHADQKRVIAGLPAVRNCDQRSLIALG